MAHLNSYSVFMPPARSHEPVTIHPGKKRVASPRPTSTMVVSPSPALTSTSTGYASIPLTAAEQTLANLRQVFTQAGQKLEETLSVPRPRAAEEQSDRGPEAPDDATTIAPGTGLPPSTGGLWPRGDIIPDWGTLRRP